MNWVPEIAIAYTEDWIEKCSIQFENWRLEMRVISASDVVSLPRGRKAEFTPNLLKVLSTIKGDSFGVLENADLKGTNVSLPAKTKDDKSKVGSVLRKHFEKAHGMKATIRWTEDGFPQIGKK